MTLEKTCPICGHSKPHSDYHSYFDKKRNRIRIGNYCKACCKPQANARAKEHYIENVEDKKEYARQYRQQNNESIKSKRKGYKKKQVEELQNCYLRELLVSKSRVPREFIAEVPEIIQTKRMLLKIKRKIKSLKNGKK